MRNRKGSKGIFQHFQLFPLFQILERMKITHNDCITHYNMVSLAINFTPYYIAVLPIYYYYYILHTFLFLQLVMLYGLVSFHVPRWSFHVTINFLSFFMIAMSWYYNQSLSRDDTGTDGYRRVQFIVFPSLLILFDIKMDVLLHLGVFVI